MFVLGIGVGLLSAGLSDPAALAEEATDPLTLAALTILSIPLQCLTAVAPVVVYHDLRVGKEGVDVEELLRVFD
jgi:hypothetical protein